MYDPQDSWKREIEVWEKKSTKQLKIQETAKYKREKMIVSIFAAIFTVTVAILGNLLVTYISSDLSFGQNCLLRIPFNGILVFTSALIGLLFRNGNKKYIVEDNSKERIQDE